MKVEFARDDLNKALSVIIPFIASGKDVLAEKNLLRMKFAPGMGIQLDYSNLESYVSSFVKNENVKEWNKGSVLVKASVASKILSSFFSEEMILNFSDSQLTITDKNNQHKIHLRYEDNDFVEDVGGPFKNIVPIDSSVFQKFLTYGEPFVAVDSTAPALMCIRILNDEKSLSMTALDGTKISYSKELPTKNKIDILIPGRIAGSVKKVLPKTGNINLSQEGNSIYFWNSDFTIKILPYVGKYPDMNEFLTTIPLPYFTTTVGDLKRAMDILDLVGQDLSLESHYKNLFRFFAVGENVLMSLCGENNQSEITIGRKVQGLENFIEIAFDKSNIIDFLSLYTPETEVTFSKISIIGRPHPFFEIRSSSDINTVLIFSQTVV